MPGFDLSTDIICFTFNKDSIIRDRDFIAFDLDLEPVTIKTYKNFQRFKWIKSLSKTYRILKVLFICIRDSQ